MKVLIYGECDQFGSGAWCYYQTLKDMGHQVSFYTQFTSLQKYTANVICRAIRWLNGRKPLIWDRNRHVKGFLRMVKAERPQIVIILKGLLIDNETICSIKTLGAWTVLINHDDFFSAFKGSRSRIQFSAIPFYNYVFCTKEVNVGEIRAHNSNIEMMSFAYHPAIHCPPGESECDRQKWESDIVFVGSCYPERFRQMEYLVKNIGCPVNLKIYGANWNNIPSSSVLRLYIQNRTLKPADMSKAIYYSKIALGFLCKENRDDYTQRSFEIPASKGVLVAERTARHLKFYRENLDAVFFDSNRYDELVHKVVHLLNDNMERERIRESGYFAVKAGHHTYEDRMIQLFDIYSQSVIN